MLNLAEGREAVDSPPQHGLEIALLALAFGARRNTQTMLDSQGHLPTCHTKKKGTKQTLVIHRDKHMGEDDTSQRVKRRSTVFHNTGLKSRAESKCGAFGSRRSVWGVPGLEGGRTVTMRRRGTDASVNCVQGLR